MTDRRVLGNTSTRCKVPSDPLAAFRRIQEPMQALLLRVLPAPIFDHIEAPRTETWEQKIETYAGLTVEVRRIINNQIKRCRAELGVDDAPEVTTICLIDAEVRSYMILQRVRRDKAVQ